MKQEGLFWHMYHVGLISYCRNSQGRVDTIKRAKPKDEIEPRVHYFKPVEGELPDRLIKASKRRTRAEAAWNKCRWFRAWRLRRRDKAVANFYRAIETCKQEIIDLHEKECPDCIWDGNKMDFTKWKGGRKTSE